MLIQINFERKSWGRGQTQIETWSERGGGGREGERKREREIGGGKGEG